MNKRLIAILVVILTAGLVITGCTAGPEPIAAVGNVAPDFQLQNLNGQSITLSSLKGNPVLINFWATWCQPCASEMPYLQKINNEWSDKGLVVLAINWGESASEVGQFLQANNLSLPVLLDTKKAAAEKYGVRAFPTTFFIDKDGIIREKIIGAFPNQAAIESRLSGIMP
jgi:peroxiredoxin